MTAFQREITEKVILSWLQNYVGWTNFEEFFEYNVLKNNFTVEMAEMVRSILGDGVNY